MKKTIFLTALAVMFAAGGFAQERYSYSVGRRTVRIQENEAVGPAQPAVRAQAGRAGQAVEVQTVRAYRVVRPLRINWAPETNDIRRYTITMSPLRLINNGLKFDFEVELPHPGHWFGTSLVGYLAPPRSRYWDNDGNNRYPLNAGGNSFHKMWGIGTSAFFKNTFHRRGWYFATGLVVEYFNVGRRESGYFTYREDGLTFYERGDRLINRSYLKPTVQFNFGKHFALSRDFFFDLYVGLAYSYSIRLHSGDGDTDEWGYYDGPFDGVGGFAYRGVAPVAGFRLGFLLDGKGR